MNPSFTLPESVKALLDALPTQHIHVPSHWHLRKIDVDFDVDCQLQAIRDLMKRNKAAEDYLAEQIKQAEHTADTTKGMANEYAVDRIESLVQDSVFQDAAHSMAAVGMLAPFLETIFTQCFRGIGDKWSYFSSQPKTHDRLRSLHSDQWDCHKVIENGRARTDLVKGIQQLADATGLKARLPSDLNETLAALFGYRNKMFHCGFEWPVDERNAFQNRIDAENWPKTWFATATIGDKPWIFYMTDEYIEHCLKTTDYVLSAFGDFVKDELRL